MKHAQTLAAAAIVALALTAPAWAKTTTWTGGATGKAGTAMSFLAAANWDNGVPEPGDTVVINVSAYASDNPVYIGHENGATDTVETFDIGSAGLTFDISSSYTKLLVNFTGSGRIVKTGAGRLGFACSSDFTGGCEVRGGALASYGSSYKFGTATIVFDASYGGNPRTATDTWGTKFVNNLSFTGDVAGYSVLSSGQEHSFGGDITATHDISFSGTYGAITFKGNVSAPGHTITVNGDRAKENTLPNFTFEKSVDANLVKQGNRTLTLSGVSTNADNRLEIQNGTCAIAAAGYWGGTNIVLAGAASNLTLNAAGNLSPNAAISIAAGCTATITVANGVIVRVKSLSVGGTPVADGAYDAGSLPAALSGSGFLVVSETSGKRTTWIGERTGTASGGTPQAFLNPANWDNGVPVAGDTIVVTNAGNWNLTTYIGTDGESLDIGSAGLTVETPTASTRVKFGLPFTGSGRIVKFGLGLVGASVDSSHAGGTLVMQGKFESYKRNGLQFGSGLIEFRGAGYVAPRIETDDWGWGMKNDLLFAGSTGSDTVLSSGQDYTFWGDISAEHDISFSGTYNPVVFKGTVSAPGKTISVNANRTKDENYLPNFTFEKTVTGSVVKTGNRTLTFKAASGAAGDALTVNGGTVAFTAAASWGGTNIVVNSGATALTLNGSGNLAPEAVVRITTTGGAKIGVASGVKVEIAELWVDGVQKEPGVYDASNLPAAIAGAGRVKVGSNFPTVISLR